MTPPKCAKTFVCLMPSQSTKDTDATMGRLVGSVQIPACSSVRNVPEAWRQATQEQRNRFAGILFDAVTLEKQRVVAVKPSRDFIPFFHLSHEEHRKYQKRPRWDSNPRSSA